MGKVKTKEIVVKSLPVPREFAAIHNLNDLRKQDELYQEIKSNIEEYQEKYMKSFTMDVDEVMAYIPDSQKGSYTVVKYAARNIENFEDELKGARYSHPHYGYRANGLIVDTKNRKVYEVLCGCVSYRFNKIRSIFTVSIESIHTVWHNYNRADGTRTIEYNFCVATNTLQSVKDLGFKEY